MSYLNSFSPEELTINELAERQRPGVLAHYKGELEDSQNHFCDLCHRPTKLQQFFKRFNEDFVGFEQQIQEMAFKIGVTQTEFNFNQQRKDMEAAERYARDKF